MEKHEEKSIEIGLRKRNLVILSVCLLIGLNIHAFAWTTGYLAAKTAAAKKV